MAVLTAISSAPLFGVVRRICGRVKSGPGPVWKLTVSLNGLPAVSTIALKISSTVALAGRGALGVTTTCLFASENRMSQDSKSPAPVRMAKVEASIDNGLIGVSKRAVMDAFVPTPVSPFPGRRLVSCGGLLSSTAPSGTKNAPELSKAKDVPSRSMTSVETCKK